MAAESILIHTQAPAETVAHRFDNLIATHGPSLQRLAAAYTNSASDRDDLFQEIVLAIWKSLASFRGESSDRTFIFRIAHNRAMAHLVRRPKRPTERWRNTRYPIRGLIKNGVWRASNSASV